MSAPGLFDRLEAFWRELVRRRVIHVAGVYALLSWVGVYMVATTYEILLLPSAVLRFLLAATFLGFPLMLVLAWYLRLGRGGVRIRRSGTDGPGRGTGVGNGAGAGLLVFGLLLAGGSYLVMADRLAPPKGAALEVEEGSVAVLPFEPLGAEDDDRYFSDGMTDEVIARLARIPDLKVISRTSTMRYRDTDKGPREIGRELGVATLLESSLRREADRIRISARLLDARTERTLWAETFDRELEDVLALQSELAERIAESLGRAMGGVEALASAEHTPAVGDVAAYELYLRGRFFWNRRDPEGLDRAVALLEDAVAMDPGFARAHAALADAFVVLPYHTDAATVASHERAREAAERALDLEPTLGEAHAALAFVHTTLWEWARAEEEFLRALELAPGYATGHQWYAAFLVAEGRIPEGLAAIRHARSMDPLSLMINDELGLILYVAGEMEAALEQFESTAELEPGFPPVHLHRAWVLENVERYDGMVEALETWNGLLPVPAFPPGSLRRAYEAGEEETAFMFLAELPDDAPVSPIDRARWNTWLGRTNEAFRWLERAFEVRDPWLTYIRAWPFTQPLRNDPRFSELLQRMNLADRE